jgi:hypothetical protein
MNHKSKKRTFDPSQQLLPTFSFYTPRTMQIPSVNGVQVLMEAPVGYHVNFANPQKDTATIIASYWAFGIGFLVSVLFLGQSLYTASFIRRAWRIENCK